LVGRIRTVEDKQAKQRFCEELMDKFSKPDTTRPKGFFRQIDLHHRVCIGVERVTGKEKSLPPFPQQWSAKDMTKTPNALPAKEGRRALAWGNPYLLNASKSGEHRFL
jgi:uncharacterized protein